MKYPSWSYKPNIRKRHVILTPKGWVVQETGELLVSNVHLPKTLKNYFKLDGNVTIDNDSVDFTYQGSNVQLPFNKIQDFITNPSTYLIPAWDGTPKNNLMAELGDSFIENGQQGATSDGYRIYGIAGAAADLSGQVVRRMGTAGAFGTGGDSSLMAGARINAAIASGAGVIFSNIMTNDEDKGMTVEQSIAEVKRWKQLCYDNKVWLVLHTPAPRGNDAFPAARLTGDALTRMLERRTRLLSELPGVGCIVVDTLSLVKPGTTFDLLDAYSAQDGKHPGTVGAYEGWGPLSAAALKQIYPNAIGLPSATTSKSLNVNVEMTGASATSGATLPTGYTGTNATGTTGVTRNYREVSNARGRWAECVVGGVAATANAAIDIFRQINLHTALVVGKTYECVVEYEFDAGISNVLSIQLGMQAAGSSTAQVWDNNRYATQTMSNKTQKGWMRTPPFTAIAGLTDFRIRLAAYLATTGAPSATIRVRNMELREVV